MSLPKKLKQLRDERNWSQRFVANLLNVHRSTISKYETGQIIPTYPALLRLADIYKVDKAFLIDELDDSQTLTAPETGTKTYVLKERPMDHDLELIKELLQKYPDLKKSLLELYNFDDKSKALAVKLFYLQIQAMKQR